MKLYIDTKDMKSMYIEMTEEENESYTESIKELSFGFSGLALHYLQDLQGVFSEEEMQKAKNSIVEMLSLILTMALEDGAL
ncbi:MAG: hypothetical protein J6K32_11705 [Clostridia bacterium]|nr:hypothetical protein [Clostridia bacterium]